MLLPAFLLCAVALQDPSIPTLIERLASESIEEREKATNALRLRGEAALPHLRKAAAGDQGGLAERALRLLRWIEAHKLLTPAIRNLFPDLEKELLDGTPRPWSGIFKQFHHDPDPELDELSPRERTLICEGALREAGSDDDVTAVFNELFARPTAIDPSLVIPFAKKDGDLRLQAIMILATTGGLGAVRPLRELLASEDGIVRSRAATALGVLKTREVAPDLRALLSRRPMLRTAVEALGRIGAKEAEPDLRALLKEKGESRSAAALALADLGAADAPDLLAGVLLEEEYPDQSLAAERLARMGPAAVPALRIAAKKGGPVVRQLVVDAIPGAGGKDVVPDLVAALGDAEFDVRRSAVIGLQELLARNAVADLKKLLKDEAPVVKIAAADALCSFGDDAAATVLLAESKNRLQLVDQVIPLTSLNALRQPEVWARLAATRPEFVPDGRIRSVLNRVGKAAGLKVEISDLESDHDSANDPWKGRRLMDEARHRTPHLLSVLWRVGGNGAYDFILEPDRIRVVPHTEAVKFWSDWLKRRAK